MKTLQANPQRAEQAVSLALRLNCEAIAWNIEHDCNEAVGLAKQQGLRNEGWLQVARDPQAALAHPEWMHCPQHHEWLRLFPDYTGGHPALVSHYIGLNTVDAFQYGQRRVAGFAQANGWLTRLWLADIQGAPMGCGCGNPCCRSWDNAPGAKLAPTPYEHPTLLFPLEFYKTLRATLGSVEIVPILCPECERGITLDGVADPDGPEGTNLCQGIPCVRPCALDYFPALSQAFRHETQTGLLLMSDALGKNHPIFGEPRAWAKRSHRHYGLDFLPCVEPEDANAFEQCLILTDAPQDCFPVAPPVGYVPEIPPILCGYCPP